MLSGLKVWFNFYIYEKNVSHPFSFLCTRWLSSPCLCLHLHLGLAQSHIGNEKFSDYVACCWNFHYINTFDWLICLILHLLVSVEKHFRHHHFPTAFSSRYLWCLSFRRDISVLHLASKCNSGSTASCEWGGLIGRAEMRWETMEAQTLPRGQQSTDELGWIRGDYDEMRKTLASSSCWTFSRVQRCFHVRCRTILVPTKQAAKHSQTRQETLPHSNRNSISWCCCLMVWLADVFRDEREFVEILINLCLRWIYL